MAQKISDEEIENIHAIGKYVKGLRGDIDRQFKEIRAKIDSMHGEAKNRILDKTAERPELVFGLVFLVGLAIGAAVVAAALSDRD